MFVEPYCFELIIQKEMKECTQETKFNYKANIKSETARFERHFLP